MAFLFGGGGDNIDPNTYLNLARLQGYVSNPNIITPYGTSYTQWGQFDQAGYDAAQKKYESDLAAWEAAAPPAGGRARLLYDASKPAAPKKEDFVQNKDQATITQALAPILEDTLHNQQQAQWQFGNAGRNAAVQAAAAMSQPFKYTGPDIQTSIDYEKAGKGPTAGQFGLFKGGVDLPEIQKQLNLAGVRNVNYGPETGPQLQTSVNTPTLQRSLDTSSLAAMPVNAGTTAQQAIMSRLQPQLERERAQLQTQLTNQGLAPGGEAYNTAMQQQSQRENDLLTQAALQGINLDMSARQQGLGEQQTLGGFANQAALSQLGANLQGAGFGNQALQQQFGNQMDIAAAQRSAQEQDFMQRVKSGEFGNQAQMMAFNAGLANQQAQNDAIARNFAQAQAAQQMANQAIGQNYSQNLGAAQFGNQAENQLLNQQLGLYNQPLSTATNLLQASQFQNPNFSTGFQAPNYSNIGSQMQNDANAAQAQRNQNAQGIAQIGSTVLMAMSDRRLKSNIVKMGDDPRGFGIYEYDIFGRRERGVMAQEVEKIIPDAVMEHPSGYKMVNYGAL